jgi:hypothetical protein
MGAWEIASALMDGKKRRQWLDRQDAKLTDAVRYYGGPAADPVMGIAKLLGAATPGADMMDMAQSSQDLMASRSPMEAAQNAGWLGAASLGMFVPGNASALKEELANTTLFHGTPNKDVASGRLPLRSGGTERRTDFGNFGDGVYATPKEFVAKAYAEKGGQRGGVVSLKAALKNPIYIPVTGPEYTKEIEKVAQELGVTAKPEWAGSGQRNAEFARQFREKAIAAGHDGVMALNDDNTLGAEVSIFDDNLIQVLKGK